MLEPQTLRDDIKEVLSPMGIYSVDACELLVATCAQESHLGTYRRQINGPALGIFQMEPETFNDIWTNYLAYHSTLAAEITALAATSPPRPVELITNDPLAIAMCRVHYMRAPGALPSGTDLLAMWHYYKAHYNTPLGAATQDQFFHNYQRLVGGPAK